MLEYLFFNDTFAKEFADILMQKDVEFMRTRESVQNAYILNVPETIDDDVWDEIDDIYDVLSAKDTLLVQENLDDNDEMSTAGIYIQLANAEQTVAKVNLDVMNRMLSVVSMDEFNEFIEVIVSSVEDPDDSPICKK